MKRIAISRRILRYASIAVLAFGFSAAPAAQRGVNMAGADFAGHKIPGIHGTDYWFNSAPSYQYFGGKSLKLIRVPILWDRLQRTLGGTLETDYLNGIKNNVAWAKANGCSVIIDLHNYGRYAIDESGTYTSYIIENTYGGVVKVTTAHLSDVWRRLSTEFRNESAVYAYGMMNEPHDMGSANWKLISQNVLTAIRASGDNKMIMVSVDSWSGAHSWVGTHGPTAWITDPANNFKYEAHQYFDSDSSGTYRSSYQDELARDSSLATIGQRRMAGFINWCATNGVKGFLGEYSVPKSDERWLTVLENFLSALDSADMDGTYWSAGEWWGEEENNVQPRSNFTVDAVQLPTLLQHLGTVTPVLRFPENPTNTISGLDRSYYLGQWGSLPDFPALTAARVDISVNFTITPNSGDNFAYAFTGFINAPADGTYTFYTTSDDGSKLVIGSTEVVNNDGLHASQERSRSIGLRAGRHAVRVTFFEQGGGETLDVSWSGPGLSKQPVADGALSRVGNGGGRVTGLNVTYFANPDLSGLAKSRIDETVDFDWGGASPDPTIGSDTFSARWEGEVQAVEAGSYTFQTFSDDGIRLWVGNVQIINNWTDHGPSTDTATTAVAFVAGERKSVRLEFYENGGGATAKFLWKRPGLSTFAIKPKLHLYPSVGQLVANGTYRVVAKHSGKVLDVSGVSTADSAIIHQWVYAGGKNQKWQIEGLGGSTYKITAAHSSKVLEVADAPRSDGAPARQSTWTGAGSQKWKIEDTGGGFYRIVAEHSNNALDVSGGPTALQDGANVVPTPLHRTRQSAVATTCSLVGAYGSHSR